jgi:hypothetical protein
MYVAMYVDYILFHTLCHILFPYIEFFLHDFIISIHVSTSIYIFIFVSMWEDHVPYILQLGIIELEFYLGYRMHTMLYEHVHCKSDCISLGYFTTMSFCTIMEGTIPKGRAQQKWDEEGSEIMDESLG